MQNIYADGIANIRLIDGIVRLDLVQINELDQDTAKAQAVGTLAMSVQALLRTHQQLSAVLEKMVAQGLLKKETAPPAADVARPITPPAE